MESRWRLRGLMSLWCHGGDLRMLVLFFCFVFFFFFFALPHGFASSCRSHGLKCRAQKGNFRSLKRMGCILIDTEEVLFAHGKHLKITNKSNFESLVFFHFLTKSCTFGPWATTTSKPITKVQSFELDTSPFKQPRLQSPPYDLKEPCV